MISCCLTIIFTRELEGLGGSRSSFNISDSHPTSSRESRHAMAHFLRIERAGSPAREANQREASPGALSLPRYPTDGSLASNSRPQAPSLLPSLERGEVWENSYDDPSVQVCCTCTLLHLCLRAISWSAFGMSSSKPLPDAILMLRCERQLSQATRVSMESAAISCGEIFAEISTKYCTISTYCGVAKISKTRFGRLQTLIAVTDV